MATFEKQKSKKNSFRYGIAAIAVAAVLVLVAVLYVSWEKDDSGISPTPLISLGIEEYDVSKTSSNGALFNVTVKNHASDQQTGLLVCRITPSNYGPFFTNLSITLSPGEVRTFQITVDLPPDAVWTPVIPSGQVDCHIV